MTSPKILLVALAAAEPAAAHRDGSWMRAAVVDPQVAYFRHVKCFANIRGSGVLCVHTRPGKRIPLAARPQGEQRCGF